jgi:hypothetical protein
MERLFLSVCVNKRDLAVLLLASEAAPRRSRRGRASLKEAAMRLMAPYQNTKIQIAF